MIRIDDKTWIVANASSWIEGEAERQLRATSKLAGVAWAVGMPDLHPGKGNPIGISVLAEGFVYPHLVGGDIGCGMAVYRIDLDARFNVDRLAKKARGLDEAWSGDSETWLRDRGIEQPSFVESIGTIGGGNHFVEVQGVAESFSDAFAVGSVFLLVHSGSRGLGESILREHTSRHGAAGLDVASDEAKKYFEAHDNAVIWAIANRALIAERFADAVGASITPVTDICHNAVTAHDGAWLHRKGAAPHDRGLVPIPGSRGTCTYFVTPTGNGDGSGHSLAHGAGRKWTRSDARARMRDRYRVADLERTPLGSVVICENRDLLFEEAPDAYKQIERVVADLVDDGACRIEAILRPRLTYKTRIRGDGGSEKITWKSKRRDAL